MTDDNIWYSKNSDSLEVITECQTKIHASTLVVAMRRGGVVGGDVTFYLFTLPYLILCSVQIYLIFYDLLTC